MTWAGRRKLTYVSIVVGVFVVIAALIIRSYTDVAPTCFDHRQDGDEQGVDCGGSCATYCVNQLPDPKILWVRSFEIAPGVYHVVAYVEHNNPNAAAANVSYAFKLYDADDGLITERDGTTFLGTAGDTAIVETLVQTGNSVPAITRFSFTSPIIWQKIDPAYSQIVINTDHHVFDQSTTNTTRLVATLQNQSNYSFTSMDTVALLYDADGNVITAVKSLVPSLPALGSKTVYFTWPFALPSPVASVEIIPRVDPFTATAQ